jgi:hypothetical protein
MSWLTKEHVWFEKLMKDSRIFSDGIFAPFYLLLILCPYQSSILHEMINKLHL